MTVDASASAGCAAGRPGERIQWLDLVKVVAIVLVVLVHAATKAYSYEPDGLFSLDAGGQILAYAIYTVGRLGVPLFLMASGYLLLDRSYDGKGAVAFWKKSLVPLLVTSEIWIAISYFFTVWYAEEPVDGWYLAESMLLLHANSSSYLWYIPMIIGVYLFVPVASVVLEKIDWKVLRIPLGIAAAYIFLSPIANVFLGVFQLEMTDVQIDLGFSGGCYGLILIVGYLFKKGRFARVRVPWFALAILGGLVLLVALQVFGLWNDSRYELWYDDALLLLASWGLFGLLSRVGRVVPYWPAKSIANCSFGIYVLHNIVMKLVYRQLEPVCMDRLALLVVLVAASFFASWIVVELVSHVPKVGKVLFYARRPRAVAKREAS